MPTASELASATPSRGAAEERTSRSHAGAYVRLALMGVLSFAAMYVLMYAMVDRLSHVVPNLNQAYMAGLMTAPMLIFELGLMSSMYKSATANVAIGVGSAAMLALFWLLIRAQGGIGDEEFLKSMIPHHAGAILMCEQASLEDAGVRRLCDEIIESQRREISLMEGMLRERGAR